MTLEQLIELQAKAQEKMADAVSKLNEAITAKFSTATPAQKDAEINALVDKVKDLEDKVKALNSPAIRKMVWGNPDTKAPEGSEVVSFGRFLKAVAMKDEKFLAEVKAPSGQSEGTNADGGFAVPTEFANEIIKLERQSGIARSIARIFPMGTLTRKVPRELAKPSVSWVGEGTEPSLTKGTLEQITQTAKKLMAIIPFTDELLEDNNVNYNAFIAEVVAQEMNREEDKIAFVGDVSGLSDPFNGVYFASGVTTVALEGATLTFPDMVNLLMGPKAPYRERGVFVLGTTFLKKVMKLVDDNGDPIWQMPDAASPGRILGKLYYESDQIPDTLGTTRTNGAKTAALFGDFGRGLWISPRGGYTVKASDSASNSAGKSAFTLDETWFKFRRREDITVANPEAFAKLGVTA